MALPIKVRSLPGGNFETDDDDCQKVTREHGQPYLADDGRKKVDYQVVGEETGHPKLMHHNDAVAALRQVEHKTCVWMQEITWEKMTSNLKRQLLEAYEKIYLTDGECL
jgi:uncharacterized protein YhbP (UPF0306 family)